MTSTTDTDRIAELEEEIRQLRMMLVGETRFPFEWGLKPGESRLLACLVASPDGFRSYDAMSYALYGNQPDRNHNNLSVQMARMRRRLKKWRIVIRTRWAEGFEIAPESKRFVKAAIIARSKGSPVSEYTVGATALA